MLRHYVYAAVAPSRSCQRPFDDQATRRAISFSARAAPDTFGDQPQVSDGSVCQFYCEADDGARERILVVHQCGTVELLWSIALEPTNNGAGPVLPAVEVIRPLLVLADAVETEEYARLSRLYRWNHRFGKVDWDFAMACRTSGGNGQLTWSEIVVAGGSPPRAAGHSGGSFPLNGIGRWSVRRSQGREVVGQFLQQFLIANGYHELGNTVEQTLNAAKPTPHRA